MAVRRSCGIPVADDDVGAFGVEPAVDHRPVDRMHEVWAHQPVDVGELLLEHVGPLRCPDRFVDAAELPRGDRVHVPRHQAQFIFEAGNGVGVGVGSTRSSSVRYTVPVAVHCCG